MQPKKELQEVKDKVENAYSYFSANFENFYKFKKFIFESNLNQDDVNKLETLKKPILEFNKVEAYISRLMGEFSNQEPSVEVRAQAGVTRQQLTEEFLLTMDVIEAHCRYILDDTANDNLQYAIFNDTTAGGFGVMRVGTEYVHARSFEQRIYLNKVFDATLCGFDPLARDSHKGDGEFCFELSPYTKSYFIEEFGEEALKDVKFTNTTAQGSFEWSYRGEKEGSEAVMVCDFFVKRRTKKTLVLLANDEVALESEYNKRVKEYTENAEGIAVPPVIIERRSTFIEVIDLYRICGNKILDYKETDYKYLPLIFVDGNSVMLRESTNGDSYQKTRSYVHNAVGMQKLINFCGQTIAQQIENMVQHKIKVPIEAIPDGYEDVYTDVQTAKTLIYNQFLDGDPTVRLDPPSEIVQTPPPPIVESTFVTGDRIIQSTLGSYDAVLGIGDISGKAIQAGAVQSAAASDPYLVNYIRALNRALVVIVDLMPKYYKTPRSLPVIGVDGKRAYQTINDDEDQNSISMYYESDMLQIKVSAGVNSNVEKQLSLDVITRMMAASEQFAGFINSKGLPVILDNMDIRGIDRLKALSEEFVQEQAQAAEEAKGQPSPIEVEANALKEIEMMKAQMKQMEIDANMQIKSAQNSIEEHKVQIEMIKALANIENAETKTALEAEKIDAENSRTAVNALIDAANVSKTTQGD